MSLSRLQSADHTLCSRPSAVDIVTPRSSTRYYSLDFWRGVACFMVVLYHLRPMKDSPLANSWALLVPDWGWLGVPVFFVISGYCISATADSVRKGKSTVKHYAFRRFRRIYPPYLLLVLFAAVLKTNWGNWLDSVPFLRAVREIGSPAHLSAWQWLGNCTLTESWRYLFIGDGRNYLLEHSWTLCYEEQFYFVVGLLLLILRREMFGGALAISLVVLALQGMVPNANKRWDGVFWDGRWLLFAAGILVYWCLNYANVYQRRIALIILSVPIVIFFFRPRSWSVHTSFHIELLTASLFSLVACGLHRWDLRIHEAWLLRPWRYCGQICYSLYLVHWFVAKTINVVFARYGLESNLPLYALKVAIGVTGSIAAATVYYYAIERHFLNSSFSARA